MPDHIAQKLSRRDGELAALVHGITQRKILRRGCQHVSSLIFDPLAQCTSDTVGIGSHGPVTLKMVASSGHDAAEVSARHLQGRIDWGDIGHTIINGPMGKLRLRWSQRPRPLRQVMQNKYMFALCTTHVVLASFYQRWRIKDSLVLSVRIIERIQLRRTMYREYQPAWIDR